MQRNDSRDPAVGQAENPEKSPGSFAERHKHLWNGWYQRQRGFNRTAFWQGLRAAHRSVLDQIYGDVARQPRRWDRANLSIERGQVVFSITGLARRSGATAKQARFAVDRAVAEGVISRRVISIVVDGHTQNISLVSWLDFDTYDSTAPVREGQGKSVSGSEGKSEGKSAAVVSPDATTGYGDPPPDQGKSQGKSVSGPEGNSITRDKGLRPLHGESLQTTKTKARVNASRSAPPTPAEVQAVFDTWNQLGPPFPKALTLSGKRQRTIKTRLGDEWWAAHWREAIERVKKSPFCRGKNDRQWKANLDFFTRPDTATKALEGAYDGDRTPQGSKPSSSVGLPLFRGGVQQPGGTK